MPYIYLIHCRACVNSGESVYKIGKTVDFSKRIDGYDKGSIPLFTLYVAECDEFERYLIFLFSTKYKQRRDYGVEYFEGDATQMINVIMSEFNSRSLSYVSTGSAEYVSTGSVVDTSVMVKIRTQLMNKLNKINKSSINAFQDNIISSAREFMMCQNYQNLNNWIQDFSSNCDKYKYKRLGDFLEKHYGFVTNLCLSIIHHNNVDDRRLYERIKISI